MSSTGSQTRNKKLRDALRCQKRRGSEFELETHENNHRLHI